MGATLDRSMSNSIRTVCVNQLGSISGGISPNAHMITVPFPPPGRSDRDGSVHHHHGHQVPVPAGHLLRAGPGLRGLQALRQVSVSYFTLQVVPYCKHHKHNHIISS